MVRNSFDFRSVLPFVLANHLLWIAPLRLQHYDAGSKRFLVLRGCPAVARPVSTLVVTAPDQQTLDELECVTAAAVRVLTHAMQAGAGSAHSAWVVAGAGCTEAYLAGEVRKLVHGEGSSMRGASSSTRRLVHRVMLNYADCLEQSCGMHTADAEVVRQCGTSESQNKTENCGPSETLVHSYGWSGTGALHVMAVDRKDAAEFHPVLVADAHSVLDSLDAKLAALSTACVVANSLLRIDCSIEG